MRWRLRTFRLMSAIRPLYIGGIMSDNQQNQGTLKRTMKTRHLSMIAPRWDNRNWFVRCLRCNGCTSWTIWSADCLCGYRFDGLLLDDQFG